MKRYIPVQTLEQMICCMLNGISVDVWFEGELELTSQIHSFDDEVVVFKEGTFLRANVELRVRENYFKVL